LEPFLRAMRRRLDRDRSRVYAYHDDLRGAALKRLGALAGVEGEKAEADRRREQLRVTAVEREYRAKLDDLRHNYALGVTVESVQALELFVPVQRFHVLMRRRKGERLIQFDWHPLVRLAGPRPYRLQRPAPPAHRRQHCRGGIHGSEQRLGGLIDAGVRGLRRQNHRHQEGKRIFKPELAPGFGFKRGKPAIECIDVGLFHALAVLCRRQLGAAEHKLAPTKSVIETVLTFISKWRDNVSIPLDGGALTA
jgi:hypothetical protein